MRLLRWGLRHKAPIAIVLGIVMLPVAGYFFWGLLVGYIDPGTKGASDRKDVVQTFALVVAGVFTVIGGIVGIENLRTSRRNLEQQRELEEHRAQDDALQAYFERMGELLTQQELKTTERNDIKVLAQALTITLARRLDGTRKAQLVHFLHETGLIDIRKGKEPVLHLALIDLSGAVLPRSEIWYVRLRWADLSGADFSKATLAHCDFTNATLREAKFCDAPDIGSDFRGADLTGADLSGANLPGAKLTVHDLNGANFEDANLQNVEITDRSGNVVPYEELEAVCKSLKGATMPDGQKYADWLKSKSREEDGENE